MSVPVLYYEQSCPYSIRAAMALLYSGLSFELRAVSSGHPPAEVFEEDEDCSLQFPVLKVKGAKPCAHSMEIMRWALLQNDPDGWMDFEVDELEEMHGLVRINDSSFARDVIEYVNCEDGKSETRDKYRKDCELFLTGLEEHLQERKFLFGDRVSYADFAIFPFVDLFTNIRMEWFRKALFPNVWRWLDYHKNNKLFKTVSNGHALWTPGSEGVRLPAMQ